MELLLKYNKILNSFVWGPYMLVFLVGTGVYYTCLLYTSFESPQARHEIFYGGYSSVG